MANEWTRIARTELVPTYRGGWLGVWDALVAAVKRQRRLEISRQVTLSVWVKLNEAEVQITYPSLETGEQHDGNY